MDAEYHRRYYEQHGQAYRDRAAARRKKALEYLRTVKKECSRCGEKEYVCLALHHRDPSQKEFDFGSLCLKFDRLVAEVAKCDVVCHNCHSKIHAR